VTDHLAKQAAYAAKRAQHTQAERYPTILYRVVLPDDSEKIERVIGLSQIAAYYPDAKRIERLNDGDKAGFW
jgi:hypothetical protein